MATTFFDKAAETRIEQAVGAAEARSRGEIVPALVPRSAAYLEALDRGGVLALLLASAAYLAIPASWVSLETLDLPFGLHLPVLLLVQVVAFLVGWSLAHVPAVAHLLLGRRSMETAVRWRAEIAFRENHLTETREGTGILIFASLFERQVVVLADRGIHEKVGDEPWKRAVDALVAGMGSGDAPAGFVKAIELVGDELARHFPRAEGDVNELPDRLRT